MKRYPSGSQWRRWDLHVHTPNSVLENQFKNDWDQYLSKIESVGEEIAVIGITDYCTVSGYEKILTYRKSGRISNILEVIPNIEFRMTPPTQRNKGINLHLLVNPTESDHLEKLKKSLNRLSFSYSNQKYSCNESDLIMLGKAVLNQEASDEAFLKEGVNQFKPSFENFKEWYEGEAWLKAN